jgi:hypothetical protein
MLETAFGALFVTLAARLVWSMLNVREPEPAE